MTLVRPSDLLQPGIREGPGAAGHCILLWAGAVWHLTIDQSVVSKTGAI